MPHTAGPWNWLSHRKDGAVVSVPTGNVICIPWQPESDALLIAAVPELFEACEEVCVYHAESIKGVNEKSLAEVARICQEALAKAKGRELIDKANGQRQDINEAIDQPVAERDIAKEELLAACKLSLAWAERYGGCLAEAVKNDLRSAIAKAEPIQRR